LNDRAFGQQINGKCVRRKPGRPVAKTGKVASKGKKKVLPKGGKVGVGKEDQRGERGSKAHVS